MPGSSISPDQLRLCRSTTAFIKPTVEIDDIDVDTTADTDNGVRQADLFGSEDQAPYGGLVESRQLVSKL